MRQCELMFENFPMAIYSYLLIVWNLMGNFAKLRQ